MLNSQCQSSDLISEGYTFEKRIHIFVHRHTYEMMNAFRHTMIYENKNTFAQNERTNLRGFNKLFGELVCVCAQSVLWYI